MTQNTDNDCPNCVTPWKCNGPHADVAQPVEQLACTEPVAGSIPAVGCTRCAHLEARIEFLEALLDVIARDLSRAQKEIQRR